MSTDELSVVSLDFDFPKLSLGQDGNRIQFFPDTIGWIKTAAKVSIPTEQIAPQLQPCSSVWFDQWLQRRHQVFVEEGL